MGQFAQKVLDGVARLRGTDPGLRGFGANGHRYRFNPVASERKVVAFERKWAVALPADYREFMLEVGNGGAGPFYGIFPIGQWDGAGRGEPWTSDIIGDPAKPFRHRDAWNERPDEGQAPADEDSEEYERWVNKEDARYWSPKITQGSIPICTKGCALRFVLVVTGPEAGHVWADDRADYDGLTPLGGRKRLRFSDWYLKWLEKSLAEIRG